MRDIKKLRYVRVISNSQKIDRQVEEGDRTKYDFFFEEKVSRKTELFPREKGSIIKELLSEGKVGLFQKKYELKRDFNQFLKTPKI
jgi:hypothetical protein|tara:strand:- start:216 stop:473 length:258 start_codon:yes stop_codon:yes gene_type:complete